MTPAIRLTERERAQIRKDLYEQKKTDMQFITEAINEASVSTALIISTGFARGDGHLFLKGCQKAVMDYIESELAEKAEQELLSSKSINGARYLQA